MKNIKIEFDPKWILSKREESILPVEAITKMLKSEFESEIIYSDLTTCEVVIDNQKFDDKHCKIRIIDFLKSNFKVPIDDNVFTINVCDYDLPKDKLVSKESDNVHIEHNHVKANNESTDTIKVRDNKRNGDDPKKSAIELCNDLIGADEFKKLVNECSIIAPGICAHDVRDAFTARSYLFSINSGYGFSTYAELFLLAVEET